MANQKTKPSDSLPDVQKSRNAEATGGVSSTRPEPNAVYEGEVIARQADGTYRVAIEDPDMELDGVQLAFPVLGGLLGLQIRSNLPQNTKVKLVYGTPAFIFAVLPENNTDWLNARTRSLVHGPNMDEEQGVTENNFSTHAEDLLEGEVEFANLYGVAMEFLTTILRMHAGDRALIECHLINDMIRIISAQYRHISGLGEDLIFDHGRPTMERTWSSYRHEVLGVEKENEPFAELNGDEVDRDALEAKRVTGLGRSRFREFLGYAGDFIHSFVSDPPASLVALAQGAAGPAPGKSMIHRNSDGSIVINSVADIRIERTCRIPVPVRQKPHEDPEVTRARIYGKLEEDFLKLPDMITPADPKNAYQAAYHIRSYARWLGRYHSFARMLQLEAQTGEYKVPAETDGPAPDWNNQEADRKDVNPRAEYYDAYACITIMRDGSIVNYDGYGSSIVMINGNIQVSASRHLDLEAAGDIRVVAGGSFLVKARRNIELSAAMGGIILHGYAWFKALCEKGSMWLRSNALTGKDEDPPEPKEQGMPTPEVAGYESGESDGFAVLVEAADGHAAYRSQKGTTIAVDGGPADADDQSYDLNITTKGDLDLHARRKVDMHSRKLVRISSASDLCLGANAIISNASGVFIGPNQANPLLIMKSGVMWVRQIDANTLRGNQIVGPERGYQIPIPDPTPAIQIKQHFNHIDKFRDGDAAGPPDSLSDERVELLQGTIQLASQDPDLPWVGSSDGPEWAFPPQEEYVWDEREQHMGIVPETITQQYLRLDAELDPDRWDGLGYADWILRSNIYGPKRTAENAGFGTYEEQYKASDAGDPLAVPLSTAPSAMPLPTAAWESKTLFTIKALKREGEL